MAIAGIPEIIRIECLVFNNGFGKFTLVTLIPLAYILIVSINFGKQ